MNLGFKDVLELVTLGFLILGSTWRLSAQMSSLAGKLAALSSKLDEHVTADRDRFAEVDATLDAIAPRVVRLERRTR